MKSTFTTKGQERGMFSFTGFWHMECSMYLQERIATNKVVNELNQNSNPLRCVFI